MNLNRIISIFIACFLWISSIGGQSYYQVLSDYTGQLRNGGTIEQAATNLANLIPANIRSQFKVLEYDNYIYDENKFGSMENSWADAEAKANAASPYYILFTYLSNNKSFNFDVRVKIKLPNAGTFSVIDADFIDVLKGIAEAKARVQLLSPNVDLGFVEAINGVATKLKGRLDCGNGPDCAEYSIQEMIDALHSAGYLQLDAQEVIIDSVPPGNGVIGTINAKVSFEDYSTDFGLQFKYFLQDGGSYARIRGYSKANSSSFKVNLPTGENWMDLVCIKNGSQVLVFQNLAISSGSNFRSNAFVAPIVYHALRALTAAGKEALIDFLFQLTFESISTWKDPYTAWKNMNVDGASVAAAAARGSLDYFVGIFSGGKISVSKYGNATLEGISASIGYVIDNPRTFTLEGCYNTFLNASITTLGVSLAPMFVKYTPKIITTITSKGKQYIDNINNYPFGKKFLFWFRKQSPEVDDAVKKALNKLDDIFKAQKKIYEDYKGAAIASKSNNHKGAFGEIVSDMTLTEKGFTPIHIRKTRLEDGWGEKGIDGVFEKEGKYYIVEAKYGSASLASGPPKQMSDDWITENNNKRIIDAVGQIEGNIIAQNGYTKLLSKIDKDGNTSFWELDTKGKEIKKLF